MNLQEAFVELSNNKKVSRDDWDKGYFIEIITLDDGYTFFRTQSEHHYSITPEDFTMNWNISK